MIAKNYRKHPEAMAIQLVLPLGRPVWNAGRPTTRIGRVIRGAIAALVKATPQVVTWTAAVVPTWYREMKKAARKLGEAVRAACLSLDDVTTW